MSKYLDQNGLLYLWGKIKEQLGNKVDKESGKVLSSNDYTNSDKDKLASLKTYSNASSDSDGLMSSADKDKLDNIQHNANYYELPTATSDVLGGVKIGSGLNVVSSTGVLSAKPMVGASDGSNGEAGIVPGPMSSQKDLFLKGDGSWAKPEGAIYGPATGTENGLMSFEDKKKLDAFGEASTYALKSDISNMYNFKGSVETYSALSALESLAKKGDVYDVKDTGMNYAWTGTEWDALGTVFTIEPITNQEIDTVVSA